MPSENIYIDKILDLSINNKYTKWYISIISKSLSRKSKKEAQVLFGYVESHHILPKSFKLGGEKDKENIVYLSAREHFICHWILSKMFIDKTYKIKMLHSLASFNGTTNKSKKYTSTEYSIARKAKSDAIRLDDTHYWKTEEHSIECKRRQTKLVEEGKHIFQSKEFCENRSNVSKKASLKRVKDGTHPWKTEKHKKKTSELSRKRSESLLKSGNHNFQNENVRRNNLEAIKKLVDTGNHNSQCKFLCIIETKREYAKCHITNFFPEFKQYY